MGDGILGRAVGRHVVIATSQRRHVEVYLIKGDSRDIEGEVARIGRAICNFLQCLESLDDADGVVAWSAVVRHGCPGIHGVVLLRRGRGDAVEQGVEGIGINLVGCDGGLNNLGGRLYHGISFLHFERHRDIAHNVVAVVGDPDTHSIVLHVDAVAQRRKNIDHCHIDIGSRVNMYRHRGEVTRTVASALALTSEVVSGIAEELREVGVPVGGSGIVGGRVECRGRAGVGFVPLDGQTLLLGGAYRTPRGIGNRGVVAHGSFGRVE